MTTYFLNKDYNIDKFKIICAEIEKLYPKFNKEELLIDVDNSQIQSYSDGKDKIIIVNDATDEIISAESTINLWNFKYTEAKIQNGNLVKK